MSSKVTVFSLLLAALQQQQHHPDKKRATDLFCASWSQAAVEANQNSFPSLEEAGEIESNSELVLACRGEGRESSSL